MTQLSSSEQANAMNPLDRGVNIVRRPLDAISRGAVFRQVVGWLVQILAVLYLVCFVIFAFWQLGSILFGDDPTPASTAPWAAGASEEGLMFSEGIAAIVVFFFSIVTIPLICLIAWIRGGDIRRLHDQDFTVMAIAARLIRMVGETVIIGSLMIGVLMMLLFWLGWPGMIVRFALSGGGMLMNQASPTGNAFVDGLIAMVGWWVNGFFVLLLCYLVAEFISVLFTIADESRRTRAAVEIRESTPA